MTAAVRAQLYIVFGCDRVNDIDLQDFKDPNICCRVSFDIFGLVRILPPRHGCKHGKTRIPIGSMN